MITPSGSIKILDFGVARIQIDPDAAVRTSGPFTGARQAIGSPGYMAPEQLAWRPIDPRPSATAIRCAEPVVESRFTSRKVNVA